MSVWHHFFSCLAPNEDEVRCPLCKKYVPKVFNGKKICKECMTWQDYMSTRPKEKEAEPYE